ncbi:MAG: hypothetical protein HYR84_10060 [Planctomycetes bacterium]|nr:hypothetical protein [Planctomycetota bacterium]
MDIHLNELETQRTEDLRWALHSSDVQTHAGKLVAVYKKRVLGIGVDREALVAQAAAMAQCREQEIVVVVVPSADLAELPK